MKTRTCFQDFFHYAILGILGTLGVSCYILADTFFVSKSLGAEGLTALNLAIPVYNFIHGVGLMLGMGGATRFSVCKGQNRKEELDQIYTNTIYLAAFFSVAFVLIGCFASTQLAVLLGADCDVLEMTTVYLRWLLLFAPAFILNDVLLCFVRNDEGPQLSMIAMIVGSLANVLLDYVFMFPMQMGILGAVVATGLSPVISIAIMSPHWCKRKNTFHFIRAKVRKDLIRWDLSLGFPSLVGQLSSGIVMIVFNALILHLEGNVGVAAYGVIANLSLIVVAIYTGAAQGAQPLISHFYGTGEKRQIQMVLRYALVMVLMLSLAGYFFTFFFASEIVSVFNSENVVKLQEIAVEGLKIYFISNVSVGYNTILSTFFTSIEKAVPAQILSLLRGFILIIPSAGILSAVWGMRGVWFSYPVAEFLTALFGLVIYQCYSDRNLKERKKMPAD